MKWIKSVIKNPLKSDVIGRCGGDEKPEWPRRTDNSRTLKTKKTHKKTPTLHYSISEYCNNSYCWHIPLIMTVCIFYFQVSDQFSRHLYDWRLWLILETHRFTPVYSGQQWEVWFSDKPVLRFFVWFLCVWTLQTLHCLNTASSIA